MPIKDQAIVVRVVEGRAPVESKAPAWLLRRFRTATGKVWRSSSSKTVGAKRRALGCRTGGGRSSSIRTRVVEPPPLPRQRRSLISAPTSIGSLRRVANAVRVGNFVRVRCATRSKRSTPTSSSEWVEVRRAPGVVPLGLTGGATATRPLPSRSVEIPVKCGNGASTRRPEARAHRRVAAHALGEDLVAARPSQ